MSNELSNTSGIVMIVDDTPENLAILSDTLSESGYRVLVATDGLSALEQVQYLKPDIILLDVMMPGIDGFETCNQLKADSKTATIPVLFMTALSELDNLLRGFEEGAVDYLVKPIRPPEVLARVEVHIKQARNIQRAEAALDNSPYSALAVTDVGKITWLPESGYQWLCEFLQLALLPDAIKVGALLPEPILAWVTSQFTQVDNKERPAFEKSRGGTSYSLKLSAV
jgi:CheY-like chemotaxis protein